MAAPFPWPSAHSLHQYCRYDLSKVNPFIIAIHIGRDRPKQEGREQKRDYHWKCLQNEMGTWTPECNGQDERYIHQYEADVVKINMNGKKSILYGNSRKTHDVIWAAVFHLRPFQAV